MPQKPTHGGRAEEGEALQLELRDLADTVDTATVLQAQALEAQERLRAIEEAKVVDYATLQIEFSR